MKAISANSSHGFSHSRISPLWLAVESAVATPSKENLSLLQKIITQQSPARPPVNLNRLKTPGSLQYPLGLAASRGSVPVVKQLLEGGARPEGNRRWLSPLHEAVFGWNENHRKIVRLLLKRGACAEGKCHQGDETPLMTAASHSNADMLGILLTHGARPNRVNTGGESAIFLVNPAFADGMVCIRLLLEHGANPRIVNHEGATLLDKMELLSYGSPDCKQASRLVQASIAKWNAEDLRHASSVVSLKARRARL